MTNSNKYQQVNLFQEVFYQEIKLLTGKNCLVISGGLLSIFLLVTLFYWGNLQRLVVEERNLASEFQTKSGQLQNLNKEMLEKSDILNELIRIEDNVAIREALVLSLSRDARVNMDGFSSFFYGIAKSQARGLWFTQILLNQGGKSIALRGASLKPELVPDFISLLGSDELFKDYKFNILNMQRAEERGAPLEFELATQDSEKKEK